MTNTIFLTVFVAGFSLLVVSLLWVRMEQEISDHAARKR